MVTRRLPGEEIGKKYIRRPIRIGGQVCGREGARISAGFDSDQRVLVVEDKAW